MNALHGSLKRGSLSNAMMKIMDIVQEERILLFCIILVSIIVFVLYNGNYHFVIQILLSDIGGRPHHSETLKLETS